MYEKKTCLLFEKNEKKANICFLLIIAVGIAVRIYMCINHYTSCDDLGVAFSILRGEEGVWSVDNCIHGFKRFQGDQWTYAPLQFILTSALLSCDLSYQWVLILGRLPSFIGSVAALILFAYLLTNGHRKFGLQENKIALLMSITLFSLSYENIIYAGQMENYAIGVLFSVIIIWLLLYNQEEFHFLLTTILIILAGYGQYQCFILVMAFYISVFVRRKDQKKELIKIVLSAATAFVCYLPLLKRFIETNMGNRGIAWNVGVNQQFLYNISERNLAEIIGYTLHFFGRNTFLVIKCMLIPIKIDFLANILGVIVCGFVLAGLVVLHRSAVKQIAWFVDVVLVVYTVLILMGKLTLSPSRHMLIMTPVVLICIYFGVSIFLNRIKNCSWQRALGKGIIYGVTMLVIVLFLYELPEETEGRKNRVTSAEYYINLMDKYSPDVIMTTGYTFDPYIMSKLSNGLPYETAYSTGFFTGIIVNNLDAINNDIHNIVIVGSSSENYILSRWAVDNILWEMYGSECEISNIEMLEDGVESLSTEYAGEYFGSKWDNRYSIFKASVDYME